MNPFTFGNKASTPERGSSDPLFAERALRRRRLIPHAGVITRNAAANDADLAPVPAAAELPIQAITQEAPLAAVYNFPAQLAATSAKPELTVESAEAAVNEVWKDTDSRKAA